MTAMHPTKTRKIQWISSIALLVMAILLHLCTAGEFHLRGLGDDAQGNTTENEGLLHNLVHLLILPFEIIYIFLYCDVLGHACTLFGDQTCC